MPQAKIDGLLFKEMIQSGAALLTQNRESVDALNVFPVPDGDTGTNMSQTINSAVKEMQAKNAVSVGDVAAAIARGALKGARGNSGVILSQILRGFARAAGGGKEYDKRFRAARRLSVLGRTGRAWSGWLCVLSLGGGLCVYLSAAAGGGGKDKGACQK